MSLFKIEWKGDVPHLNEEQNLLIEQELKHISEELDKADDLIFHTIFLDQDDEKSVVIVDSIKGIEDTLYLTFYTNSKWVSVSKLDIE
jgi:hypothetical protein